VGVKAAAVTRREILVNAVFLLEFELRLGQHVACLIGTRAHEEVEPRLNEHSNLALHAPIFGRAGRLHNSQAVVGHFPPVNPAVVFGTRRPP
jgi:hypothetical protein